MTQLQFGLTLPNRGVLFGVETMADLLETAEVAEATGLFQSRRLRVRSLVCLSSPQTYADTLAKSTSIRSLWPRGSGARIVDAAIILRKT